MIFNKREKCKWISDTAVDFSFNRKQTKQSKKHQQLVKTTKDMQPKTILAHRLRLHAHMIWHYLIFSWFCFCLLCRTSIADFSRKLIWKTQNTTQTFFSFFLCLCHCFLRLQRIKNNNNIKVSKRNRVPCARARL